MIKVLIGDVVQSSEQTLVNTVNCVGVMGKGVALEFKRRFPDMYKDYVRRCNAGLVRLGEPYLFRSLTGPWVLNFPTKDHWRSVSKLTDIERGLDYLLAHYQEWGITSLAVPPLGCGQGQLEWRVVGPTLYRYLAQLNIPVELYAPFGTEDAQMALSFLSMPSDHSAAPANRINPAWVAVADVVRRIYEEPYHWPVGRVTLQKIAYFVTELGLPTGLQFAKGSYGPFSPGLVSVISRLVNNGILREQRRGQMISVELGPTYKDAVAAYESSLEQWEPQLQRLADLFARVRTSQAEIVASVHFAAQTLSQTGARPSEMDVLNEVLRWKLRRNPPLKGPDVAQAVRGLNMLGWINADPSTKLPVPEHPFA